jgi:hypothetical protein
MPLVLISVARSTPISCMNGLTVSTGGSHRGKEDADKARQSSGAFSARAAGGQRAHSQLPVLSVHIAPPLGNDPRLL